jgi:uncharacterized membrane protein YiaA
LSKKRNPDPRFVGVTFVSVAALFHLAFLLGIVRYSTGLIIPRFDESYSLNKLYLIPFVVLWLFVFEKIFNKKRTNEILKSIEKEKSIIDLKNTFLVISIMIIPLIIGIVLFNNG